MFNSTQGDSGGPLTVMNEEGSHILVGIVSKGLGETCSQQEYAIFTKVSALMPWIKSSIKENGGMASCSFNFSALPTLGIVQKSTIYDYIRTMNFKILQEHHWSFPLLLVFLF